MSSQVKWAAELANVREVSLRGSADLDFWREYLAGEEVVPLNCEGRASIMIVSAEGKFAGVRFREVSVSVVMESASGPDGIPLFFLVQAYNSSRFFSWCERVFFATPYYFAQVNIQPRIPAEVRVAREGNMMFHASMSRETLPSEERDDRWMARILLPSRKSTKARKKMFFARILGSTRVYPFQEGADRIVFGGEAETDVFALLKSSRFTPQEWVVRANATHAKSKTYDMQETEL